MFAYFIVVFIIAVRFSAAGEFYVDWEGKRFVKDGKTFQYVSAGMHYFRIPHQYWEQRIVAAKSAGLNAVQTYVSWTAHEPQQGVYTFEGDLDIVRFIKLVQSHDMVLILRVGPYICAEWNFGGLPPWLLQIAGIQVRTGDLNFLLMVQRWLEELLPRIKPYLYVNGGPIIMVQIENEYGLFGCDHEYLNFLYLAYRSILGDSPVYFTTDPKWTYHCGSLKGRNVLTTIDFGVEGDPAAKLSDLRKFQPGGPFVNSEFYTGWLDHWGHKHQTRRSHDIGVVLDKMLALNASVNLYMWHGGSNFGLTSGAQQLVFIASFNPTSYDYNAPQSESGDVRVDKYWAIRNITEKYFPGNKLPVPENSKKLGGIFLNPELQGHLTDQIGVDSFIKQSEYPCTMEELGVLEGMVAYQYKVTQSLNEVELQVTGVHDRAYVLADGHFLQVVPRESYRKFTISAEHTLTIIAENMGYIGVGPQMTVYSIMYKGIANVTVNGELLRGWSHYKIDVRHPLSNNNKLQLVPYSAARVKQYPDAGVQWNGRDLLPNGPAVYTDTVELKQDQLLDTFVNITESWSKGYLIVNDILIGRYWPDAGPQFTLYVPGVWLREGTNTITLIELQSHKSTAANSVYFTDTPYIDGPVNPNA